jgi:hypothetical protein
MKAQPYPISYKFQLSVVLIIVVFHQVLGMLQPIFDLCQKFITTHGQGVAGPPRPPWAGQLHRRAVSVDHSRIPPGRVSPEEPSERRCCNSTQPMRTSATSYMVDLLQDSEGRLPKSCSSPQIGRGFAGGRLCSSATGHQIDKRSPTRMC